MPIRAVCFDVGETLIDETRHWIEWANFLGVPAMTLFTAIGVVMERGQSLRRVFEIFKPGLDPGTARKQRAAQGWTYDFTAQDLYPDAIPCLNVLRQRGYKVLIAGNQPVESEAALARLDLPADLIASSGGWGISKPDPRFFAKVIEAAGALHDNIASQSIAGQSIAGQNIVGQNIVGQNIAGQNIGPQNIAPGEIAYVGDRLDNDVLPALAAGMKAVFVRRGPWGWMHAERPEIERAHIRLDSLLDLPDRLAAL